MLLALALARGQTFVDAGLGLPPASNDPLIGSTGASAVADVNGDGAWDLAMLDTLDLSVWTGSSQGFVRTTTSCRQRQGDATCSPIGTGTGSPTMRTRTPTLIRPSIPATSSGSDALVARASHAGHLRSGPFSPV